MNSNQNRPIALPIQHDVALIYAVSCLAAVLMAVASVAGLLYRSAVYPTEGLIRAFVPNDVVNLFVGLPILLGAMWLAWRGKLLGLLCWPGALFFVLYNYVVYVLAAPLSWAFLLYLALVMLSVYALMGLVASIDGKVVQRRLSGHVPEKFAGGVLVGLGLLFFVRVIGVIVTALANGTMLAEAELATNAADFFVTPAWVIGGVLLWRRKEFGYVVGLGLLFQASTLFIALIIFLLLQPVLTASPLAIADVVVIFAMGLVCFVPFGLFVRGVAAQSRESPE